MPMLDSSAVFPVEKTRICHFCKDLISLIIVCILIIIHLHILHQLVQDFFHHQKRKQPKEHTPISSIHIISSSNTVSTNQSPLASGYRFQLENGERKSPRQAHQNRKGSRSISEWFSNIWLSRTTNYQNNMFFFHNLKNKSIKQPDYIQFKLQGTIIRHIVISVGGPTLVSVWWLKNIGRTSLVQCHRPNFTKFLRSLKLRSFSEDFHHHFHHVTSRWHLPKWNMSAKWAPTSQCMQGYNLQLHL